MRISLRHIRGAQATWAGLPAQVAGGVATNFQRMALIADSMGTPLDDMERELSKKIRVELDLGGFHTAQNSSQESD